MSEQPRGWSRYVPIFSVIASYRREDLNYDLVAGLVVGIVTVPQAIAYAFLAGLPPEAGLYACLLPMVLYALLGSSRQLVVGPVAVAALMVADAIKDHADQFGNDPIGIATVLCMQAGLLLWLLRIFQLGGIVNILSRPVISGFINGAVILIVISQIPALTGIPATPAAGPLFDFVSMAERISDAHAFTIAIGLASLLLLWLFPPLVKRLLPRPKGPREDSAILRTGPIFVAAGSILFVLVAGFETPSVGYIPAGLPSIKAPPFDLDLWIDLAPSAALIAIVAYVESFSVGSTLASRQPQTSQQSSGTHRAWRCQPGCSIHRRIPSRWEFFALQCQLRSRGSHSRLEHRFRAGYPDLSPMVYATVSNTSACGSRGDHHCFRGRIGRI